MNDSLDLRNRILKMRESNNLIVTKKDSLNNNLMSKFESSIKDENLKKPNINNDIANEKNKRKVLKDKNNSENLTQYKDKFATKVPNSTINDNQAQFLMLANKFNEAVEVILELSKKVEKLESGVSERSHEQKKTISYFSLFNLKVFIFVLLITILIFGFLTFPFDLSLMKLVIIDIFSNL